MTHAKVIIIGSGCAGLTAAIYAARANLAPIVLDGFKPQGKVPGGQLMLTTDVENFPGFPEGIQGPELVELVKKQAQRFGADCRFETAVAADLSKRPFRITAKENLEKEDAVEYTCDALIIAAGADARWLGLPGEGAYIGYGLSSCATCDAALYRGKEVAVVGGGDSAVEEATFLTKFATKVTLIHRRDELRASKIMQKRALSNPKMAFAWNSVVDGFHGPTNGEAKLTGVVLKDTVTGEHRDLQLDGLFVAIGHIPNSDIFRGQIATTPEGYILTRTALAYNGIEAPPRLLKKMLNYGTATSVEGVFACGDVVDTHYRQAITAAGSGCAAAMDTEKWLESLH